MKLIPIIYHRLPYPTHIQASIVEVAGHFDVESLPSTIQNNSFSLHTEYSAGHRNLNSELISKFQSITSSQSDAKTAKPKLWVSKEWAQEFAQFLIELLNGKQPHIIEIHPPNSRRNGFDTFSEYYNVFYNELRDSGIISKILIENRNGFSLSGVKDFQKLSDLIDTEQIDLKLILDFPQLLNFEGARNDIDKLNVVMEAIEGFKHNVDAFHLWGQVGSNAHMGDLDDYFNRNTEMKEIFLNHLKELFVGSEKEIYFIPEVNFGISSEKTKEDCLSNIVDDLESVGFSFG